MMTPRPPSESENPKYCQLPLTSAVLNLDHMRSKNKYMKTLSKWTEELKLTSNVIFFGKIILIALVGEPDDIKEYLKRLRTCNVDVASSGRPCKERMMKVLFMGEKVLMERRLCISYMLI